MYSVHDVLIAIDLTFKLGVFIFKNTAIFKQSIWLHCDLFDGTSLINQQN